jgi:hypothetical protein
MALWRNVGTVVSIGPSRTDHWQITYGTGQDVGVVVAAPNLQEINVELIALDQGVVARPVGEELSSATHYTVNIRNLGASALRYNLNIGDWQPAGGQAPQAHRVRQLPPGVGDVVVGSATTLAAKRRAKRPGGRSKKRATRRR